MFPHADPSLRVVVRKQIARGSDNSRRVECVATPQEELFETYELALIGITSCASAP